MPSFQKPVESAAYQAVSLYFTLALLKFLEGTARKQGHRGSVEKFTKSLPPIERADLGALDKKFYAIAYAPKDYRGLDHLLSPIIQGLIREYRLRIDYATGVVHEVDP